jgi:hypothetical protein
MRTETRRERETDGSGRRGSVVFAKLRRTARLFSLFSVDPSVVEVAPGAPCP